MVSTMSASGMRSPTGFGASHRFRSNSVPSTEKGCALRSPFTSRRPRSEDRNSCAIAWVSRRSRVLEKVEASNAFSSIASPTNQRNRACRTPAVRPVAAPGGSNREAATASPAATAPAEWMDARSRRKARKTSGRARSAPHGSAAASPAAGAAPGWAPRRRRKRTTPRSSDPRPASVPPPIRL